MDNTKQLFILSLKQDLQKLNQLIADLPNSSQKQEQITSWLFPTKNYSFIDEYIVTRNILQHGNEKLFLELIIDRIYVGIQLLLQQIHSFPIRKFVFSPKQVTLGYLFGNLCGKVLQMKEPKIIANLSEEKSPVPKLNEETQTDILSVNKCDSCSAAMMCMKNLIKVFESEDFDYLTEGRRFKPQILDITQFGSMLQTTKTVMDNFRSLNEKIFQRGEEIKNLKKANQAEVEKNLKMKRKIAQLDEETKMYKTEFEKSTTKITQLLYENKELKKSNNQKELQTIKSETILKNLNETLGKRNLFIQNLEEEKRGLKKCLNKAKTHQRVVLHSVPILEENLEKAVGNLESISHTLVQFEGNVEFLNGKLSNISKISENTKWKIMSLKRYLEETNKHILEAPKQWKEELLNILEKFGEKSGNIATRSFPIKGNPVEDITHQIAENEVKINVFVNENVKLRRLLEKFQHFRPG